MAMSATDTVSSVNAAGATSRPAVSSETLALRQQQIRDAAGELVGTLFFGEVFKAVRESKLKGKYGHGGRGEEVFSAQLHDVLAKKMGREAKLGLTDVLCKRFSKAV